MEQKDYKLEIVNELLKMESHVRRLAKELGVNHMTISRKIKELENENVVDFKEEGKNKKYFLKKTIEAKNYAFSTENYKLNQLLKRHPSLREIVEKLKKNKGVELAVLFGSYAKGDPKKESDIDVYVENATAETKKEIKLLNSKIHLQVGKYAENPLIKEIEKNHVIIKGVEIYYEENKFFD